MRLDDIAPRVWLLATVAAWALLAWVLALSGMGGRVALLADDPGLLQPLPQVKPSPPERLGPIGEYAEIASRPLFTQDRRPHPFSLLPESEDAEDNRFDYVLTSVLLTPQLRMAIIQPSEGGDSIRVKLDNASDDLPAWRLVAIDARSAVFEGPGGRQQLQLRVFDGTGGEPPTEIQAPPPDAAPAPAPAGTKAPAAKSPGGLQVVEPRRGGAAQPTPASPATPARRDADPGQDRDSQSQLDAVRQRIEARRAQLRAAAQDDAPQDKTK